MKNYQKFLQGAFVYFIILCLSNNLLAQAIPVRYALVIGNGEYSGLPSLKNPLSDASDMAAALKRLGFTVELLKNANLDQMELAAQRLSDALTGNKQAIGLFYFAGHGVQSNGANYLIPSNASIAGEAFLKTKALPAQTVLDLMQQSGNSLNIVLLDACRDNPFGWVRSGTRGLSVVGTQPPGSIVVYATSAGSTAQDGMGRNGVFTGELLKNLELPGIDFDTVLNRTAQGVLQATGNAQFPAIYKQYFYPAYLKSAPKPGEQGFAASSSIGAIVPEKASGPLAFRNEVLIPAGSFLMGSDSGNPDEKPVHYVSLDSFFMMKTEVTVGDFATFIENSKYVTYIERGGASFIYNAEMATNLPVFATWSQPYLSQGRSDPVVCVSWYDAIEYANWLSKQDGLTPVYEMSYNSVRMVSGANGWRLPSEAEWEYAARAQPAPIQNLALLEIEIDTVAWSLKNSSNTTHPVAQKKPNEFGLFDMLGNVWEWCTDSYYSYTASPATNPIIFNAPGSRVVRGGAWSSEKASLRVYDRLDRNTDRAYNNLGFRLVRSAGGN